MKRPDNFLAFAHIGDLHLTAWDDQNTQDFHAVVQDLAQIAGLDFVFLPGDNADNGTPAQYALVRAGLEGIRSPFHVITGDHDMEGGNLDAFYAGLGVPKLPYARDYGGVRCLFVDMCGPGTGGPDFRLGQSQVAWLVGEIADAEAQGRDCALFMHSYPADLRDRSEAAHVADAVHQGPVRLVEMGHTHYNELANDGRTVYAACRSTGQIEEGPVGCAIAAIDRSVVSWRFKQLDRPWPFVLITGPADRRLGHRGDPPPRGSLDLRALVLCPSEAACAYRVDGAAWQPMQRADGARVFNATLDWSGDATRIEVRAIAADGREDVDAIEPARAEAPPVTSRGIGSDADALGAWAEKGLLGTQLGPNRNGRKW